MLQINECCESDYVFNNEFNQCGFSSSFLIELNSDLGKLSVVNECLNNIMM